MSINLPPVNEIAAEDNSTNNPNRSLARRSSSMSVGEGGRSSKNNISRMMRRLSGISRRTSSASIVETSDNAGDEEEGSQADGANGIRSREMKKMDRTVLCLRVSVILTLVIATAVVATVTYVFISRDETDDFKHEYDSAVIKVAEGFQNGVNTKVWSAQAFSAMYTSRYGDDDGVRTWPNATMPDFQEQASGQLLLSDGRALSFNPIITNETRDMWEAHANESASILGAEQLVIRNGTSRIVADGIYRRVDGVVADDPGYTPESEMYPYTMVPVWQIAPIAGNERAVMFNLHSETNRRRALDDMLTYKVPTLTAILQLVQDEEERPSSILFYPVKASFANTTDSNEVVGSISVVFSWDTVLERILPNYLRGLVCILATNTEQAYTFQLDGEDVVFVGMGDLHDGSFDDMEYLVNATVAGTSEELGVVDNLITYQLRCYPSKAFEDQYVTNRPAIYTSIVVLIFVCTAALFLLYDYLVEHRQSRVARAAEQTGRIVNSMFPAQFRDRLFQQHENSTHQDRRPSIVSSVTTVPIDSLSGKKSLLEHQVSAISDSVHNNKGSDPARRKSIMKFLKVTGLTAGKPDYNVGANLGSTFAEDPIADLYPETSIMFCDLAGFTAWSADKSPHNVFCLLETLFWEFDQLAKQYGVFKLGTIGDCYIAVTGLPNPMENHASVLAEFTIQCKKKVEEVRRSLEHTDLNWEDLNMRFGINSGPVTAGILRGQKSRFELFGDTINTASRMESTSSPNCIQVSQETAELLRMEGMGSWLAPRQGLVSVKGKGMLSTFWLIPPDGEGNGGVPEELIAGIQLAEQTQEEEEVAVVVDTGRPRKRSSVLVPFTLSGSFDSTASETSQGDNKDQLAGNNDNDVKKSRNSTSSTVLDDDVESSITHTLEFP